MIDWFGSGVTGAIIARLVGNASYVERKSFLFESDKLSSPCHTAQDGSSLPLARSVPLDPSMFFKLTMGFIQGLGQLCFSNQTSIPTLPN